MLYHCVEKQKQLWNVNEEKKKIIAKTKYKSSFFNKNVSSFHKVIGSRLQSNFLYEDFFLTWLFDDSFYIKFSVFFLQTLKNQEFELFRFLKIVLSTINIFFFSFKHYKA